MKKKHYRRINNLIKEIGTDKVIELLKQFIYDEEIELDFRSKEMEIVSSFLSFSQTSEFEDEVLILPFLHYYYYKSQ